MDTLNDTLNTVIAVFALTMFALTIILLNVWWLTMPVTILICSLLLAGFCHEYDRRTGRGPFKKCAG